MAEKAGSYERLAQVSRNIRTARKQLELCEEIQAQRPRKTRRVGWQSEIRRSSYHQNKPQFD